MYHRPAVSSFNFKLNRAAGINFPYRSSVSGSSFANKDAASTELTSIPEEQPLTSVLFTSAVTTETTDMLIGYQNP